MRTTRQPSISNDAFTELINNPPVAHETDGQFTGRDWWTIKLKELVDPSLVHWAELDTTVEEASELLIGAGPPNVVLIRRDASSMQLRSTFDYKDLNTFLLLALGLAHPPEGANSVSYNETVRKIRQRKDVTLREMQDISNNQDYKMLSQEALLSEAVGLLAGGLHRIIVVKEESQEVVGVLTQLRLVRFFWEQGRNFGPVHDLFQQTLKDLGVGPRVVQSIKCVWDCPLFGPC
jgi:CBS domain-containing protein